MANRIWSWVGIIILSLVIVLVALRFARAYDQMKPDVDPVISNYAAFTYVRVRVVGTAMGMYYNRGWHSRETVFSQQGSGYVAKEGYIFTAAHVIIPETVSTQSDMWGTHITKPLKVLTTTILIYDYKSTPLIAKVHYIDTELDIAILKYEPTGILIPADYDLEYAQGMIEQGDVVFSFLHKRNEDGSMAAGLELRYGIVLSNLPTTPKMSSELAYFNLYDMTLSMNVQPGDSGSPLFAFRDGVPVFIGIIRAMWNDQIASLAYAVSLPNIRRYIVMEVK